jgi:uncharacterized protein (TIGR03084 family)
MLMSTAVNTSEAARDHAKVVILAGVIADLAAESYELIEMLTRLRTTDWNLPTPAQGWTIRDQVTHLAFFDDATRLALADPVSFAEQRTELLALGPAFPDRVAERYRGQPGDSCLSWFLRSRTALLDDYRDADPAARLPWYGPDMGMASSATGRLMETWAHGQDIADTVGTVRASTVRLRHVADIGVRTLAFSFQLRGRSAPVAPVRVELDGPDGQRWEWGPPNVGDVVRGSALDFCLVVTQRRHLADTTLDVLGPVATEWMSIAQAYAGAPSAGRPAGLFSTSNGEPR